MNTRIRRRICRCSAAIAAGLVCVACGGGGGDGSGGQGPPEPPTIGTVEVSSESPFASDCNGAAQNGTLYRNAEVEPYLVVNPTSPANLIAAWQQDRWSNGAAQGLMAAASFDGGRTWSRTTLPFSTCAEASAGSGAGFARASDPWLTVSADGVVHALGLAVTGAAEPANAASGMLVASSFDGGLTWSAPTAVISDPGPAMNDKGSITADPDNAGFGYVAWDRLTDDDRGPAWFARTDDGGATWEAPRSIYDPGAGSQTIGNVIAVLPAGELVYFFTQIDASPDGRLRAMLRSIRSSDRGASWSGPRTIAELLAVGAVDPETGQRIRDGSILGSYAVGPAGDLHVAWQDARFTSGVRDGIAYASSVDGGATWSEPVQVNGQPGAQAFTPTVHVRSDGLVGVMYFDLRSNTSNSASLPTDVWLASSDDGRNWRETRIAAAFDLATAPDANGLFVGDYHGLASVDREFLVLHASTAGGSPSNRTNVFFTTIGPEQIANGDVVEMARRLPVFTKPAHADGWRRRIDERLRWALEQRLGPREPLPH